MATGTGRRHGRGLRDVYPANSYWRERTWSLRVLDAGDHKRV